MTKCELNYLGLIFDCPIGNEADDCCFRNIRKYKTEDRLTYFEKLPGGKRNLLIEHHQKCLSDREKKTLFHELQ
jgi:hypothetical protein